MPIRICLITPEFPPHQYGGIGTYVETLGRALAGRGHAVTVVGWRILPAGQVEPSWCELINLGLEWPFLWRFNRSLDPSGLVRAAIALRRFFARSRSRFDVVEATNYRGDATLLTQLVSPLVVRTSTPWRDCIKGRIRPHDRLNMAAEGHLCRGADLGIAHSDAISRKADAYYSTRGHLVIPLGIDAGRTPTVSHNETVDFVHVGRAEYRKGTDLLLGALRDVMRDCPVVTVTFIGANLEAFVKGSPDLVASLRELRGHGPERFRELGRVDDEAKAELLMQADWLVMPSRFESFGLVALEAMRAGTPSILATGSGLEEIGRTTPTTVFVKPGDGGSLRAGIARAVSLGPNHKEGVADSIRRTFIERFTADRMADATEAAYYRLLNGA